MNTNLAQAGQPMETGSINGRDAEIHEALYDGADVVVRYKSGQQESVKVRKIPRRDLAQYALLIGAADPDESVECAFYVQGKDVAWAQSLDDDSFDRVLDEGQRLNFFSFANWMKRQARKLQLVQGQGAALDEATRAIESNPSLKKRLGSTNGSLHKATAMPISGGGLPTS